jgi:predicted TIM-barrel fold metal-dependent hydrolase
MAQETQFVPPTASKGPGNIHLRSELRNMEIIGVEEHTTFPELLPKDRDHSAQVYAEIVQHPSLAYAQGRTADLGSRRLKDMDECGIAVQILSLGGTNNSMLLPGKEGVQLARDINNELKNAVEAHPDRIRALAELPLHQPKEAVKELHRCVKELGFVGALVSGSISGTGKFMDGPEYDAVFSAFEELDVPLFIHPGIPPKAVYDTYYSIPERPLLSAAFALAGWGWHNEVAIHVLRLTLSGVLDRHRRLKIVVGHQGEMMPMMIQRFDSMFAEEAFNFERRVGEMLRSQVWIAISGLFTLPPTQAAIATWGVEKVLFVNDYPFQDAQRVPDFIRALGDLVAPADLRKICQMNAEDLFKIKA